MVVVASGQDASRMSSWGDALGMSVLEEALGVDPGTRRRDYISQLAMEHLGMVLMGGGWGDEDKVRVIVCMSSYV